MKSLILSVLAFSSIYANAEVYTCGFTEPFYTITYDTDSKILTVKNDVVDKGPEVITDVAYAKIDGAFKVGLVKDDVIVMTITLTGHSTDGMSNNIYPFEAKYMSMQGPNNGIGGCSTEMWPAIQGDN